MSHRAPTPALREAETRRPQASPVMFQRWSRLAFAHWAVDPERVRPTLPACLQLDEFDGRAWIGLVPFFMRRIRPRFLPPVPGLSWFLELNVRTYVYDPETGRPGVWFYSLDCNQPLAVEIARRAFHLPYEHAEMRAEIGSASIHYHCQRKNVAAGAADLSYTTSPPDSCRPAQPGSLEFFLLERYLLYSVDPRGRLFRGQVHHRPYHFAPTSGGPWQHQALAQAGFPCEREPDSLLYSPGVDVDVFKLERA